MKKYIRPELSVTKFNVESSVMTNVDIISEMYTDYLPQDAANKVWTDIDDQNWNWDN